MEETIKNYILLSPVFQADIKDVLQDTDLRDFGLDSLFFIDLVGKLEDHFCIEFPIEKMILSELTTINKLSDTIKKCLQVK